MKNILNDFANLLFIRHPLTRKIISFRKPGFIYIIPFIIVGLVSLLWFLIRVIPKPSRATYPCMKVAMPLAFSFLTYLSILSATVLFFRKAMAQFRTFRYKYALLLFVISITFLICSSVLPISLIFSDKALLFRNWNI